MEILCKKFHALQKSAQSYLWIEMIARCVIKETYSSKIQLPTNENQRKWYLI